MKVLRDFARVELLPGEEQSVILNVPKKSMAYFDETINDFKEEDITYIAYVGNCSDQRMLKSVKYTY